MLTRYKPFVWFGKMYKKNTYTGDNTFPSISIVLIRIIRKMSVQNWRCIGCIWTFYWHLFFINLWKSCILFAGALACRSDTSADRYKMRQKKKLIKISEIFIEIPHPRKGKNPRGLSLSANNRTEEKAMKNCSSLCNRRQRTVSGFGASPRTSSWEQNRSILAVLKAVLPTRSLCIMLCLVCWNPRVFLRF